MKKVLRIVALLLVVFCMAGCKNSDNTNIGGEELCVLIPSPQVAEEENGAIQEDGEDGATNIGNEYSLLLRLKTLEMYISAENEDLSAISNLSLEYVRIKLTSGTDTIARESLKPYKITSFGKFSVVDYDNCVVNVNDIGVEVTITFNIAEYNLNKENIHLKFMEENSTLFAEILLDIESGLKMEIVGALESIE